jgi:hypothetical protein
MSNGVLMTVAGVVALICVAVVVAIGSSLAIALAH